MSTSRRDLPAAVYRDSRPVDPVFEPNEMLYRRCVWAEIEGDRLLPYAIRFFPDWSVNRAKHSDPEHVLLPHHLHCGVAVFQVGDVPPCLVSGGGVAYDFRVEHAPEEENYAHSEVRTYRDGRHLTPPHAGDLPLGVKKQFRMIIGRRARVVRLPRASQEQEA